MRFIELIPHMGDVAAILFVFPWFIYYFYKIQNRSVFETYLLCIAFLSLVADILFTVSFLKSKKIIHVFK